MKKIAVEEHFLTRSYREYLRTRTEPPRRDFIVQGGKNLEREWWAPGQFVPINPDLPEKIYELGPQRLKDMDESGIDLQLLSFSFPGIEPFEARVATPMSRSINDELAEAVKRNPTRYAGLATIAPQDPNAAAAELERAVTKLGMKGAMITGNIRGEFLDDEKFWPIFETAQRLDVPIYIHPRTPPDEMVKPFMVKPVLALAMWGFAAEAGLHAMRLIVSGVFDKYPKLKIVMAHLGEAIPFWLWRLESRWPQNDGGTRSEAKPLLKTPTQYFKDNFYVTTSGMFWAPVIQFVISVLGIEKVLFAVDYPYESSTAAVKAIDGLSISAGDKEKIYHGNAEKIFRL